MLAQGFCCSTTKNSLSQRIFHHEPCETTGLLIGWVYLSAIETFFATLGCLCQRISVTTRRDSGHRPIVLEHRMMKSYNDCCDQSSSSLVAEHCPYVGGDSRYRMRAPGRDAYAR